MKTKLTPEKQEEIAEKIFDDWKDTVLDKNSKNMPTDFATVFDLFFRKGVGKKIAKQYVPRAIAYYTPSKSTKKWVYDRLRLEGKTHSTKEEFFESWDDMINKECRRAYYEFYPPKKYAKPDQSAAYYPFDNKEDYEKYRQYADGFKTITKEDLDRLDSKRNSDFKDFVDKVIQMSKENGIVITEDELLGKKH
jgi:hypothetical protein